MNSSPLSFVGKNADCISGAALCIAGILFFVESSNLPFGSLSAPDAGFFPRSLATALFIAGIVILMRSFGATPAMLDFTRRSWGVAMAIGVMLLYGALVERLGFLICTVGILFALLKAYGGLGWKLSLLIAVPSVVATYLGFVELGVPLPAGVLTRF
jgi:hypothetical protein